MARDGRQPARFSWAELRRARTRRQGRALSTPQKTVSTRTELGRPQAEARSVDFEGDRPITGAFAPPECRISPVVAGAERSAHVAHRVDGRDELRGERAAAV